MPEKQRGRKSIVKEKIKLKQGGKFMVSIVIIIIIIIAESQRSLKCDFMSEK